MKIQCEVEKCPNFIEIDGAVSPNFRYICSGRSAYGDDTLIHERQDQLKTIGRRYNPTTDEADKLVHFQSHQFDRELDHSRGDGRAGVNTELDDTSDVCQDIEELKPGV